MPESLVNSTNLESPFLGPELPIYPEIDEIVKVVGSPDANNVYPANIGQFSPPLSFRLRVACYVWEPNSITLQQGFYNCRLSGSYTGVNGPLPLYTTTCCTISAGSSSSLAGH